MKPPPTVRSSASSRETKGLRWIKPGLLKADIPRVCGAHLDTGRGVGSVVTDQLQHLQRSSPLCHDIYLEDQQPPQSEKGRRRQHSSKK